MRRSHQGALSHDLTTPFTRCLSKRPENAREIYALGLLRTEVATASTSNAGEFEWSLEFETTPPRVVGDLGEPELS